MRPLSGSNGGPFIPAREGDQTEQLLTSLPGDGGLASDGLMLAFVAVCPMHTFPSVDDIDSEMRNAIRCSDEEKNEKEKGNDGKCQ